MRAELERPCEAQPPEKLSRILLCAVVDGWRVRFAYLLYRVSLLLLIALAFAFLLLLLMLIIVTHAWSRDRIRATISGSLPLSVLFALLLMLTSAHSKLSSVAGTSCHCCITS